MNKTEKLILPVVSQQRELLKFFAKNWNENQATQETCIEDFDIEECIKNFNYCQRMQI